MTASLLLGAISAAILLQVTIGIGVGFWRHQHRQDPPQAFEGGATATTSAAWPGWRAFRVEGDAFEDPARTQRTLVLAPVDGLPLPDFAPGQYLTFSIDLRTRTTEPKRTIVRCYSLSARPNGKTYQITVKRVPPPSTPPDLPAGAASSFLHDALRVGDTVMARAPAGLFVLDTGSAVPAVFIAGGIGVTPMISMIAWSLAHQPERPLFLFYGVRNSADHAFKVLVEELSRSHPAFAVHVVYSSPAPCDVEGRDFQHAGLIDVELLKRVLPHGRHQFYVCGPPAMMAALVPALADWGVPKDDVCFESFGPGSSGSVAPVSRPAGAFIAESLEIRFRRSRRTIGWTGADANLLDFAERRGISVESGCRTGSCGACEVRLVSGEVRYVDKPDFALPAGACLLCVGIPLSNLVLEA